MKDVQSVLPHRYPMLMIDEVIDMSEDRCTAIKNITKIEPCFQGHFPGNPIFPGVLMVEALAQTCGYWMLERNPATLPIFSQIQNARFRRPVLPGDQIRLEIQFLSAEKKFYNFEAKAYVGDVLVTEATLVVYEQTID